MAWIAKFLSFETDAMVVSKPFNTKEEAEEWGMVSYDRSGTDNIAF